MKPFCRPEVGHRHGLTANLGKFIVVTDQDLKERISEAPLSAILFQGIRETPVNIVVCVDPKVDPYHFVEDGQATAA